MPPAKKKAAAPPPSSMKGLRERLGKRYGNQVVTRSTVKTSYEVISTGSLTLDLAHRTGGLVEGRIHEYVGPEGVGKTTSAINAMVSAQRKYPKKAVGYIDMEQTFDYAWAEGLGLDTSDDRWLHIYPDDAEDVSDLLRRQAETGIFSMIVVDSIGGMESKAAFDKDAEEKVMGNNAQIITRMVKHCAVLCRRENVTVILVNQLRADLGGSGFEQSAGPKAMKYATTTKTVFAGGGDEPVKYRIPGDVEDTVIGRSIRARVQRSKVAVQGKKAEFYLFNYDTDEFGPIGIDRADEAVSVGVLMGIIKQRGSWYDVPSTGDEGLAKCNGKTAAKAHLRACPDDMERVRSAAVAMLAGDVLPETEVEAEMVP